MRPILILAMAFVLSPFSQPAGGQAVAKGPWEQLKEKKTAWFLLGAINDDGSLATVKTFVWVKQVPEESSRILPGKGDRIRLLSAQDLVIIDYATKKEAYALVSPLSVKRRLEASDYTKQFCPEGTVLDVADIATSDTPINGLRQVWVRVTPPPA